MKYRITKSEKGYRAEIGQHNARNGVLEYIPIEEDDNYLCSCTQYYETEIDAIEACKKHHQEKGYDKLPKVVDEFEL